MSVTKIRLVNGTYDEILNKAFPSKIRVTPIEENM
jgi:hypothetical protein